MLVAEANNSRRRDWFDGMLFGIGSSFGTPVCGDTCEEEQVEHPQVVFLQLQPMAPISYLRFIYATWQCDSRSVCHPTVSDIYGIFSAPLPCCRKRLSPD